jgi:hypothetical protein
MVNSVFGIYTDKTERKMFNENFTKAHKFLHSMKGKRIVYAEEVEKSKMNTELMKDMTDGDKFESELLFSYNSDINIEYQTIFNQQLHVEI